jgi:hypothetical protein
MYTLFKKEENYYLISKNSISYDEYSKTCEVVLEGTKKQILLFTEENEIDVNM